MMADETERARYLALKQIIQAMPRADWLDEIRRIEAEHPEWSWTPPPPITSSVPPPPPPPPPSSSAVPPPPPPSSTPPNAAQPSPGTRVSIELDDDKMAETVEKTLAVLGARLRVFQSAGQLVEVQFDPAKDVKFLKRDVQTPRMVAIGATRARMLAAEECSYSREKLDKKGAPYDAPCLPPEWLGGSLVTYTNFPGIPVFTGLAQAPTLRPDGALIREPGYDTSTGIYLAQNVPVNVPETPNRSDAQRAAAHLLDLVSDFDFVNDANKSAWLAGVLSTTCRYAFSGPAPMIIIDASRRGSGKTMLADLASIIASGQTAPRMSFTDDDTEIDKRITAFGLGAEQFVLIDNIVGKFGSPSLDAALTSTTYRGRILGKSEMSAPVSMNITWFATGNGIIVGEDMARRAIMSRLEPQVDHPEDRSGPRPGQPWKHPNLIEHVKRERVAYLSSALTVVKAYIVAGRPTVHLQAMGSFEDWSNTIRAALVWAGAADPCETRNQVREADVHDSELRRAIECWPVDDNIEVTTATLVALAANMTPDQGSPAFAIFNKMKGVDREQWRNALLEWVPPKKGDLPSARELGYALRAIKGRVVGEFKISTGKEKESGFPWKRTRLWDTPHFATRST